MAGDNVNPRDAVEIRGDGRSGAAAAEAWREEIEKTAARIRSGELRIAAGAAVRLDSNGAYTNSKPEKRGESGGDADEEGGDGDEGEEVPGAALSEIEELLQAAAGASGGLGEVHVCGGFGREMDGGEVEQDVLRIVQAAVGGTQKSLRALSIEGDQARNPIVAGDEELAALLAGQPLERLRLTASLALADELVAALADACPGLHSLAANFWDEEALGAAAAFAHLRELTSLAAVEFGAGLAALADGPAGRSLRALRALPCAPRRPAPPCPGTVPPLDRPPAHPGALARMPRLADVGIPLLPSAEGPEAQAALAALRGRFGL
eukprot:tig00021275_g19869.t1